MKNSQITHWCQEIIRSQAPEGGVYIDATMGRGNDTAFLCRLAGTDGKVMAFDIQEEALRATRDLLKEKGYEERASLLLVGHEHMDQYVEEGSVDVVCFNFGYLPGGDHGIATRCETSLAAIAQGLKLLKAGGMMSLCIYSGGDSGFEEKEKILKYLKRLPAKEYTVIVNEYYNRENQPPVPVFVFKD